MKILIVDDEDMIREVIKEYCLASSFDVREASDGKEARNLNTFEIAKLRKPL